MKSLGPIPKVGPARYSKAREHLLNARKHLMLEREGKPNKAQKYWRIALNYLDKEREDHARQIERRPLTNYHAQLAATMNAIKQLANPLDDTNNTIERISMLLDLWEVYPAPKGIGTTAPCGSLIWRKRRGERPAAPLEIPVPINRSASS
jgi:hypothetical protein